MIDVDKIYKEVGEAGLEALRLNMDKIEIPRVAEAIATLVTETYRQSFGPHGLILALQQAEAITRIAKTAMLLGFSAGRRYGQQEVIDTTIAKLEEK